MKAKYLVLEGKKTGDINLLYNFLGEGNSFVSKSEEVSESKIKIVK